jgi:pimeloyl-[acyl-carrier protein] methyl ester esterase
VAGPVLVIHGEADAICPVAAGRALAAALPAARLVTLPGAGHACFVGREAEVAGLLAGLGGAAP